jgi:hypothetical protein
MLIFASIIAIRLLSLFHAAEARRFRHIFFSLPLRHAITLRHFRFSFISQLLSNTPFSPPPTEDTPLSPFRLLLPLFFFFFRRLFLRVSRAALAQPPAPRLRAERDARLRFHDFHFASAASSMVFSLADFAVLRFRRFHYFRHFHYGFR